MEFLNYAKNLIKNNNKKKITNSKFKNAHSFKKRLDESSRIVTKYEDRVPIICERMTTNIPELDRKKYLCPTDLSLGNFAYVIRKRMNLQPTTAIYLFINHNIIPCSKLLGVIYEEEKDEDGFLYIKYGGESTFG